MVPQVLIHHITDSILLQDINIHRVPLGVIQLELMLLEGSVIHHTMVSILLTMVLMVGTIVATMKVMVVVMLNLLGNV
jgi:hypothetical protein